MRVDNNLSWRGRFQETKVFYQITEIILTCKNLYKVQWQTSYTRCKNQKQQNLFVFISGRSAITYSIDSHSLLSHCLRKSALNVRKFWESFLLNIQWSACTVRSGMRPIHLEKYYHHHFLNILIIQWMKNMKSFLSGKTKVSSLTTKFPRGYHFWYFSRSFR